MAAMLSRPQCVNIGPCKMTIQSHFQLILDIDGWGISLEIVLLWMSLYLADDRSALVTRPQWVKGDDQFVTSHIKL